MSSKKITSIDGLIVTTPVISSLFGLTDRRVRQLVEEGVIDRVKNGSYELAQTVKRYVVYLRASADGKELERDSEAVYMMEKTKHEAAKRQIAEIELAQMRGQMHDAKDVEREMTKMLTAFRAKLITMPSKIAPILIAQNEIAIIQDIIQKEVYEALSELSEYDPQLFRGDKFVDIDEEEVEGDLSDEQEQEEDS
jgi:phage terminase Nu1 subunit (DNA packaging protein)